MECALKSHCLTERLFGKLSENPQNFSLIYFLSFTVWICIMRQARIKIQREFEHFEAFITIVTSVSIYNLVY